MGLLGMDLDNVPDPVEMSLGRQHVEIKAAKKKTSDKSGRDMIALTLISKDEPEADPVFHRLMGIMDDDEDQTKRMFRQRMKEFFDSFEADYSILDDESRYSEMVGLEANATVKKEKNDLTGEDQIVVSRFFPL